MAVTRLEALAKDDLPPPMARPVPEWGGDMWLKVMKGDERVAFLDAAYPLGPDGRIADERPCYDALLVQRTACDQAGTLIFTVEDVATLARKNGALLHRVALDAARLNALVDAGTAEAAKN